MARSVAQNIPDDCLLLILEHLWSDAHISRFFERRSQRSSDYDQRRIHSALRERSLAPLHVCRSWRVCALPQFFRSVAITMPVRKAAPLPLTAAVFVDKLFLEIIESADEVDEAAGGLVESMEHSIQSTLPSARTLGLCFVNGHHQNGWHLGSPGSNQLAQTLACRLPRMERIWLQSLGHVSRKAASLVASLQGARGPCITAILVPFLSRRNSAAIDIIHASCSTLQFLALGQASGGVLGDLLYLSQNSPDAEQVVYPKLQRLLFSVDAQAHIYANLPNFRLCPFPQLEELYFDDTLSNGLPREEWYAPLYDMFLKHPNMRLKYLTFPIVYNTRRTVSRRNCPLLVDLRHIKCCWATGVWSAAQAESDSTRVLKAIATIPTLARYIHPSYITRLSSVPTDISCLQLGHLDLYGWPLTLRNITWIATTFTQLKTLRVTVATGSAAEATRDGGGADFALLRSSLIRDLTVGATSAGLEDSELPLLADILFHLPKISRLILYSRAYSYVKSILASAADHGQQEGAGRMSNRLAQAQIVNLDGHGLSGQILADVSARTFPLPTAAVATTTTTTTTTTTAAAAAAAAARPPSPAPQQAASRNSWHIVRELMVGD
ncbi:hypothetical protein GQ54DRAFT_296666 [Martensiomyces pterosporus]|nr:hypothetical protein GQ54DRAFT_296666 [Martensiomyces pterosporus]